MQCEFKKKKININAHVWKNRGVCAGIIICDRQLEQKSTITETVRVKSGSWDSTGKIFFYTTLNHIKYCLPNGSVYAARRKR